jgi:hypothetical protein
MLTLLAILVVKEAHRPAAAEAQPRDQCQPDTFSGRIFPDPDHQGARGSPLRGVQIKMDAAVDDSSNSDPVSVISEGFRVVGGWGFSHQPAGFYEQQKRAE